MAHIWTWILNFTGINFGQNSFANHMYNFWSGLGSDITEFALIGALISIYRHHVKNSRLLNKHLLEANKHLLEALHNHKKSEVQE